LTGDDKAFSIIADLLGTLFVQTRLTKSLSVKILTALPSASRITSELTIFVSHLHCCLLRCIEQTYYFETLIHNLFNRGLYGIGHKDTGLLMLVLL
jgi:hypothetical protein